MGIKKICLIALLTISIVCSYFFVGKYVNSSLATDSGFDTGYSGGGSSGHSWSSGSSSSSSGGSGEPLFSDPDNLLFDIFFVILMGVFLIIPIGGFVVLIILFRKSLHIDKKKAMTEENIQKIIPGFKLDEFLQDRLEDYKQIQIDWMNFNYDGLKSRLTDELYNQYVMQLKTLSIKGQKNVMGEFTPIDMMVKSVNNVNGRYEVVYELEIEIIDYIEQDGKAVRGNKNRKMHVHYEMLFVSSSSEVVNKCPSCGAEIEDNASVECKYCHNVITRLPEKWLLSKKEVIAQRF